MENSNKVEEKMDNIIKLLGVLSERTDNIKLKLNTLESKIDKLDESVNGDLFNECKKMGEHIDFVEKVYDNVKNPLGFLCNKINYFSKDNQKYNLTDTEPVELLSNDEIDDIVLDDYLLKECGQ